MFSFEFDHLLHVGIQKFALWVSCVGGGAKVDVTPKGPVLLAGYGGRTTEHQGVDRPLWARALVIGDEKRVAVVALDNCGVPQAVTNRLAKRLAKHGISSDRLVVAATHTHNAPTLLGYAAVVWMGRTTPEQDRRVAEYTEFVIDKMEEAVLAALDRREPMQLEWAQGRATFGGNRRVIRDGKWAGFGFQRNAPVDHSMPVLAARDSSGKVRAVWANYACHCTTVGSRNRVGGDWAGFANDWMEEEFAGAVSLMTIGCGADVGPQPSGSLQVAEEHGRSIAAEAKRLLTDGTIPLGGSAQRGLQADTIALDQAEAARALAGTIEVWWVRSSIGQSDAGETGRAGIYSGGGKLSAVGLEIWE